MDILEEELKDRLGDNLEFNILLKSHTTLGVGGIADYFFHAQDIEQLVQSISLAENFKIPYIIIGGGSNVVFSDMGFKGLVIKNESKNIVINNDKGEVIADSGVSVSRLLNMTASENLGGIEFLAGIPGTLGGAIYGNAGSQSSYIGDYVKSVTMLDRVMGAQKVIKRSHDWMEFSYRSTKLKRQFTDGYKPVILTVHMRMAQKRSDEILKSIQENMKMRRDKQPAGEKSCGSWFKNPGKLPEQAAGYLLDRSGVKKMRVGGASISRKHANFIVNQKDASAKDIRKLSEMAKQAVYDNYDITLEEEIEYLGNW